MLRWKPSRNTLYTYVYNMYNNTCAACDTRAHDVVLPITDGMWRAHTHLVYIPFD